jgi:hypothetical protein
LRRPITIFALRVTQSFQDVCVEARRALEIGSRSDSANRQDEFVQQFLTAFLKTDWSKHSNGDDWPTEDPRH